MSLDSKGRITIPAPVTRILQSIYAEDEGNVVISVGEDHCILVYPMKRWIDRKKEIDKLPELDRSARNFKRTVQENTYPAQLDSNNRIRIPQRLLSRCGVEKNVVAVGRDSFLEIWDAGTYEGISDSNFRNMPDLAQEAQRALKKSGGNDGVPPVSSD